MLALIIAISLVIQQSNDEPVNENKNDIPAREVDSDDFLNLMISMQWPINGKKSNYIL